MKRFTVLAAILVLVAAGLSAQDLSGLGRDFEVVIEELGAGIMPALEQSAIWGQYPGASPLDDSRFFVTVSLGGILTDGVLGFVDDPSLFAVLDVPDLFAGIVAPGGTGTELVNGMKTFFPLPVARTSFGLNLRDDLQILVGVGGFPQFATGWGTGLAARVNPELATLDSVRLSMLHAGGKVRKGILADAGRFPAVSVGGGYSYSGFTVGYPLAALGEAGSEYGQLDIEGLGQLNVKGEFLAQSRVHTFGLDLLVSKALGFFVPYVGLSPYYHFASFAGSVGAGGEFDAFVDYQNGGDARDVVYNGEDPDTTWVDNGVSIVLFGGFDLLFGDMALQVAGSWSIAKGSPGVTLSVRR